jgi:3-phosphoshikimate 1-carboxyvinyltransferase
MDATVRPSSLKGLIHAPASKSSMQRACAAALVAGGKSIIHNPGTSNDDKAAISIIQALGAQAHFENEDLVIQSRRSPDTDSPATIDCRESGLSIRMFTPIAALSNQEITITGSGSLATRPMDFFDEILPQLAVKVKTTRGKLPITVHGPLIPGNITVDGSLSSQFLTGLLMAYAAAGAKDVTIEVENLKSRPYIDLTLEVMKQFGLKLPINNNYASFYFDHDTLKPAKEVQEYTVEGDWSGGAFLLVAGALAGNIMVRGLDITSTQADRKILDALMNAGAGMAIEAKGIRMHQSALYAFEFDATDCPDLFPPLVSLAAYCGGQTYLKGVHRLLHKESNRAISLQEEFGKMGTRIDLEDDIMIIHGGNTINGAKVHSHHDHRIAMACAITALHADSETVIQDADAVNKSYPAFFDNLKKLGADVSLSNKIKLI